jgi:lysophospholipase L1-like esterase
MKQLGIVLLCLGFGGAQAPAPTYQDIIRKWQTGAPIRAVMIGNSVGQGYYATGWEKLVLTEAGDPRGRGKLTMQTQADDSVTSVATLLRRLLRTKNPTSVLVNESADGHDTNQLLGIVGRGPDRPLDTLAAVIATKPAYDVAFVPFQINDLGHGLPWETYQANMRTIVQRLKDAGIVPVLVKENDINRPGWARYMAEVDVAAAEKSVAVIDTYTPFHAVGVKAGGIVSSGLLHDHNLHPNQAGHDLMFKAYEEWFKQSLPPSKVAPRH